MGSSTRGCPMRAPPGLELDHDHLEPQARRPCAQGTGDVFRNGEGSVDKAKNAAPTEHDLCQFESEEEVLRSLPFGLRTLFPAYVDSLLQQYRVLTGRGRSGSGRC